MKTAVLLLVSLFTPSMGFAPMQKVGAKPALRSNGASRVHDVLRDITFAALVRLLSRGNIDVTVSLEMKAFVPRSGFTVARAAPSNPLSL